MAKFAGPPAAVPPGGDLWARRSGLIAPRRWRSGWASAACSCSRWWMRWQGTKCSPAPRAACRRDAGGDAQAGQRQDPSGLSVELLQHPFSSVQAVVFDFAETRGGQHVRGFLGVAERRNPAGKAAGHRRLQRLQGAVRARRDRGRLRRMPAQVPRAVGQPPEPRWASRRWKLFGELTTRGAGGSRADSAGRLEARRRRSRRWPMHCTQWMRCKATAEGAGRIGNGQAFGLQPAALGGAHALHRRASCRSTTTGWRTRSARCTGRSNWLFARSLRAGKRAAAVMSWCTLAASTGMTCTAISKTRWPGYRPQPASRIGNAAASLAAAGHRSLSIPLQLNRRQHDRAARAEHAAVTGLWAQQGLTLPHRRRTGRRWWAFALVLM